MEKSTAKNNKYWFQARAHAAGYTLGPAFRTVRQLALGEDRLLAVLKAEARATPVASLHSSPYSI